MMATDNEKREIVQALSSHVTRQIPATMDLWPTIQERMTERTMPADVSKRGSSGGVRRGFVIAAVFLLVMMSGIAVTAAAITQVRDVLARLLPGNGSGTGFAMSGDGKEFILQPPPPFRVATLGYIPAGLTQRATSYVPAQQPGVPQLPAISSAGDGSIASPGAAGSAAPNPSRQARDLDMVQRLSAEAEGGGALWFRYFSPSDDRSVEITELSAKPGQMLPAGERLMISGNPATIQQQGGDTILTLVAYGTRVTIQTNLGRTETVKVAQSLHWQAVQPTVTPRPTLIPSVATADAEAAARRLPKADPAKVIATIQSDGAVVMSFAAPLCPNGSLLDLDGKQFVWNGNIYVLNTNAEGGYGVSSTTLLALAPPPSVINALVNTLFRACRPQG
ncbi:MAG: hypothetical protein ACR2M3_04080 [Thermomicrobiales bacterium]